MGRPANETPEEKAAKLKAKADGKAAAVIHQKAIDLDLLALARDVNPFRYTINKRVASWMTVAQRLNTKREVTEFDDRRCRERVTKLMNDYQIRKPPTGTGAEEGEEFAHLNFLVAEDDRTDAAKKDASEKDASNRALAASIQQKALETLKDRQAIAPDDDNSGFDEMVVLDVRPKKHLPNSPMVKTSPQKYKRRKVHDATSDYLSAKQDQFRDEQKLKRDLHVAELKDREDERAFWRDQLAIERAKMDFAREKLSMDQRRLELDEKERERRFQTEQARQSSTLELLKAALLQN